MDNKAFSPGDAKITLFDIVSMDGSLRQSMINQVTGFDIYESIMLPLMVCDVLVRDSINLLEKFPIIGEEFIELEVKNPETQNAYFFRFKTVNVSNKVTNPDGKMMTYMIRCMSEEVIENSKKKIQKRFTQSPYSIVADILTDELKTKKKLFVDDTPLRGNETFLVNNISPLQVIDMVRKRTVSTKYSASAFNFFENRNGFNFTTVDKMLLTGKDSIGDKIFFYDSHVNNKLENIYVRNMLAYKQVSLANPVELMQSGGVSNQTQSIDIRTGKIETINFNLKDNLTAFTQIDKGSTSQIKTNSFLTRTTTKPSQVNAALQNFLPKTTKNGESFRENKVGFLQSFVGQIVGNIVQVLVYGDTTITAGNVVKLKFPEISGTTDKKSDSRLSSGNYLVTKVRHTFVILDKVHYKTAMECVKPSYGESDI